MIDRAYVRAGRGTVGAARWAMRISNAIAVLVWVLAVTAAPSAHAGSVTPVASFGSNPGALKMYEYIPSGLPAGSPLVVVLHGCTQTASAMQSAGWNQLADQLHFAVVYAEQASGNNPVSCFNWAGEYGDTANLVRGQGENQSIISMVDATIATHHVDPNRVFITGFSAGAAFAAVMLATWPDRFAAGAILEGVPYRCATTVSGAYSCQSPGVGKTPAQWGELVRAASTTTAFPRVQIWQGTTDTTVVPMNQTELVDQWTDVHGTDQTADQTETLGTATRKAYVQGGVTVVETYTIEGMAHAVAIGTDPAGACTATAGAYFADHGICSTLRAARFFGLTSGGGTDTTAPTVAFVSPVDGDSASGSTTVVVGASDDVGVAVVDLAIDGAAIGSDAEAPYQFTWDAAVDGDHVLVATARDAAGNVATSTITLSVGAGGGGGGGGGSNNPDGGPGELPSCSLDAGGGPRGFAPLGLALVFALRRRRR